MEGSSGSQQNPPELEVIGEESTPRPTDQDSEETQCRTSVRHQVAKKKRYAVEDEDVMRLPGEEEKEEDRDGSSQERMGVDNTEHCHVPTSGIEPSTALAKKPWVAQKKRCAVEDEDVTRLPGEEEKEEDRDGSSQEPSTAPAKTPWGAEKKKYAIEHEDVSHLSDGGKYRDVFSSKNVEVDNGTVPDRDEDKEDDLDSSQEKIEVDVEPLTAPAKKPWGAVKKKYAVQHEDITHLPGEEKEEENKEGFFQENMEVYKTEQCHEPSTALAKEKMKLGISEHDSLQQQQQQQQQQQRQQLPLQQPASHPQPATTSLPQSPVMSIRHYQNHALWFFPLHISQSTFRGRIWSNACTFIALLMAKFFIVDNNATVNVSNEPSSLPVWLEIVSKGIQEGNSVHDRVTGGQPINFAVDEAIMHLGGIGKIKMEETLDVGFTNEGPRVPQFSLSCYLERLSHETSNTAAIVIVNEMTICFVARDGKLFVLDSHAHFPYGAMVGVSDMSERESFLAKVKQALHLQHNMCSVTFVKFL